MSKRQSSDRERSRRRLDVTIAQLFVTSTKYTISPRFCRVKQSLVRSLAHFLRAIGNSLALVLQSITVKSMLLIRKEFKIRRRIANCFCKDVKPFRNHPEKAFWRPSPGYIVFLLTSFSAFRSRIAEICATRCNRDALYRKILISPENREIWIEKKKRGKNLTKTINREPQNTGGHRNAEPRLTRDATTTTLVFC